MTPSVASFERFIIPLCATGAIVLFLPCVARHLGKLCRVRYVLPSMMTNG